MVALRRGDVLRFGNADPELHNVHVQGAGADFNRGVAPASTADFPPDRAGVFRVGAHGSAQLRVNLKLA